MTQVRARKNTRTKRQKSNQILVDGEYIAAPTAVTAESRSVGKATPTMMLMRAWLVEDATDSPDLGRIAEQDLREFKRNMNRPRKEAGARLVYPEVDED